MRLVFDLESNGLMEEGDTIWCIASKDIDTDETFFFGPDDIPNGVKHLLSADLLIGHNIAGFDVPFIEKVYDRKGLFDLDRLRDTLVMSKLMYPSRSEHNLESWGKYFKRYKPEHEDWTQFSPEMQHRCIEDVEIQALLYKHLVEKECKKYPQWAGSINLEVHMHYWQAWQELVGIGINREEAEALVVHLDEKILEIEDELDPQLPITIKQKGMSINKPFKKNGELIHRVTDWFADEPSMLDTVHGKFSKIEYHKLNIYSPMQVSKFLLTQGWIPTTYNRAKNKDGTWRVTGPKLTEDSFHTIKGELGQRIARHRVLVHRRRFIKNEKDPEGKGLIACIREDGRVPANGILCATPTGRTTHRDAVCNVPKAKEKVPYGIQLRRLYCVQGDDRRLLGADLKQIEARITAHYAGIFDDGEYWRIMQEAGDIHDHNAELIGSDRDTAKSFQYALFYGAGVTKLAQIIGCSAHKAKKILNDFWEGNRGVFELKEALKKQYDAYGFILGLDGRKLHIRHDYKLLNSLIQSAAGIVWKRWGIVANQRIAEACIDCPQVIAYHDEYEYDCEAVAVPLAIPIIKAAAVDAGSYYNLRVPIGVDVKVGTNWAEVH